MTRLARYLSISLLFIMPHTLLFAGEKQWYLGATGGGSLLDPITGSSGFVLDQDTDAAFKVFAGYDFTDRWSIEGFYSYLGEATFVPANFLEYETFGLGGQFSWPDNNDGFSVFVKGGVNSIRNFSSLPIDRVDDLQFYSGVGIEYHINDFISIRAEADYYEEDAQYAGIGVRFRFGGKQRIPLAPRAPEVEADDGYGPEIDAVETVHTPAAVDPVPVVVPQPAPEIIQTAPEYIPDTAGVIVPGISTVLEGVTFEFASPRLTPESKAILNAIVRDLQAQPDLRVKVDGHTDSIGNDSYNRRLSLLRARSVAIYLVEQGIDQSRVKYLGFGGDRPRADNDTEQGRQLNRRVEILAY